MPPRLRAVKIYCSIVQYRDQWCHLSRDLLKIYPPTITLSVGGGRAEGGVRGLREREDRQQGEGEEAEGGDQGAAGEAQGLHRLERARTETRAGQAAPSTQRAQAEVWRGRRRGKCLLRRRTNNHDKRIKLGQL